MSKNENDEWLNLIETVKPLNKKNKKIIPAVKKINTYVLKERIHDHFHQQTVGLNVTSRNFSTNNEETNHFKKKKIQARIDLHGCTQIDAKKKLDHFFQHSQIMGYHTVLVITGKGIPKDDNMIDSKNKFGIIRELTSQWFDFHAHYIVSYAIAQPKDGGSGAFYVHVRKKK